MTVSYNNSKESGPMHHEINLSNLVLHRGRSRGRGEEGGVNFGAQFVAPPPPPKPPLWHILLLLPPVTMPLKFKIPLPLYSSRDSI